MPTVIVSTDIAGNVKPCFASSTLVGLTLRSNGEEETKVLDMNGSMVNAQFPTPTAAPVLAASAGTDMESVHDQYAAYVYVWAATKRYPLVENDITIGGSVAPRGMPSPSSVFHFPVTGSVTNHVLITVTAPTGRPDIDQVWIFRTAFFVTSAEATTNADAGNLFFLAAIDLPTVTFIDHNPLVGTDQIEMDNFGVPTFRYCTYVDPYWWGWGNFPLSVDGSWVLATGVITITDGTKWFTGRNGQYVRLENVTTGGIGNNGLWLFKWLTNTTAQLTNLDGTPGVIPAGPITGKIVVQGPPSTLYRSKPRNPFSWGFTEYLPPPDADTPPTRVPQVYAFKIGGGLGTAISPVPTVPYLLLCTEFPAGTFTLDLRAAGSSSFENTLRKISNFYSITSHFSMFTATRQFFPVSGSQQREEKIVLWGWDAKNFCIVETDGIGLSIVSERISKTLRTMTQNRSRQLLAHGAYDAKNKMNCMWLPQEGFQQDLNVPQVNLLIMHHAPTDQWFIHDEKDILCSAQFQDGDTNLSKIYVGTETGLLGEAFVEGFYANWIASGRSFGTIGSAVNTAGSLSVTRNDGLLFFTDPPPGLGPYILRPGYIGNWCLILDPNGENEQWARISNVTTVPSPADTLHFDYVQPAIGNDHSTFNPAPVLGSVFMVGTIECRALKYFDTGIPSEDKTLKEIWLTIDGVDFRFPGPAIGSTFLRAYRERTSTPFAPKADGRLNIFLKQVFQSGPDGLATIPTQVWFTQAPPTERNKCFGIEIIDRGFVPWRLYNWVLKVE